MNNSRILYLFTRTSLHVGAGSSVGAIDQPIVRERHTGFPLIPASSLKGSFADQWEANLEQDEKRSLRVTTRKEGNKEVVDRALESAWLFGSNNEKVSFTGAIQFGEGRLLVFPIRSAKGSFAWITSPLILRRSARDGVLEVSKIPKKEPKDDEALICGDSAVVLGMKQLVLEEYTFNKTEGEAKDVAQALAGLLKDEKGEDPVWKEVATRLVILSDGMMSFFVQNACEVAQHVRIDDATGTAASGALFNQENVPSETLFYSVLHATQSRLNGSGYADKNAKDALDAFREKLDQTKVFQFGGDASTGLGYCTVKLAS